MINFNLLSLENRVLVSGIDKNNLIECIVLGVGEDIRVLDSKTKIEYTCNPSQLEAIPLTDSNLISLGFSKRVIREASGNVIDDLTTCKNVNPELWFILSLRKIEEYKYFLEVKECNEIIGSGFVKSLHQLQNQVKFITDGRCKI